MSEILIIPEIDSISFNMKRNKLKLIETSFMIRLKEELKMC